jgi:hypothetical protein
MKQFRIASLSTIVLVLVALAGGQTASSSSHWVVVASPNVSVDNDNILAAVAANSASDVWAVGQFIPDSNPDITSTLAEHWDGTSWSVVSTPNVGTLANALFAVTAKAGLAWAAGYFIDSNFKSRSLIEAWDGQQWNVVDHPHTGASDQFFGVSAISPSDIWAVGVKRDAAGKFATLTEHFDGNRWSIVASPNPGTTGNQLYAVVAISSSSVWAVGQQTGDQGPDQALIEHWDGSKWSVVTPPVDGAFSLGLFAVGGVADNHVRAVGDKQDNIQNPKTLAIDGVNGTFTVTSSATIGSGENHLYGIAAASNDLAFAVGDALDPKTGNFNNLVEVCGATSCTKENVPNPSRGGSNQLGGVTVVDGTDVWAVGAFDGPNAPLTLILHRTQ